MNENNVFNISIISVILSIDTDTTVTLCQLVYRPVLQSVWAFSKGWWNFHSDLIEFIYHIFIELLDYAIPSRTCKTVL